LSNTLRQFLKFLRLLAAFGASVWGMRWCIESMQAGTARAVGTGILLLAAISIALFMIVGEEVHRDALRATKDHIDT